MSYLRCRELFWRAAAAALLLLARACASSRVCFALWRAARGARQRADGLRSLRLLRALAGEAARDAAPSSRRPLELAELGVGREAAFDEARRLR